MSRRVATRVAPVAFAVATLAAAQVRPSAPPQADAFGYRAYDQGAAECTYAFIDIATSGGPLTLTASAAAPAADDGGAVVALAVPFELYGSVLSSLVLSSNGYLAAASTLTEDDGGDLANDAVLPAIPGHAPAVAARILVLHDELSGFASSGVALERHFPVCPRTSEALGSEPCTVLQWHDWSVPGGGAPFDLQAVLYHGSFEIVLQLHPGASALPAGTIGIQNATATIATQYVPAAPLAADTAVCLFEPRYPAGGPLADLEVTNTDKLDAVTASAEVVYEMGVRNRGPSPAPGTAILDPAPAGLVGCAWTCAASPGSSCAASGSGGIDEQVDLAPGGWVDYVLTCSAGTTPGDVENTLSATPPAGVTDPDPSDNVATDVDRFGAGAVDLRVGRPGDQLLLDWSVSCLATDTDYAVYEGTLGAFAARTALSCGTAGATNLITAPPAGNAFYLVVARNALYEGSYGSDGAGVERPALSGACFPQAIGECP